MVADIDGPAHPYMHSAPGCWERYGSLEDWKLRMVNEQAVAVVQDLVDCYAAQHATNLDRRNRQSVAIHLMSLCAGLEHGLSGMQRRDRIGSWAHCEYPALEPHPVRYPITAVDVAHASEGTRARLVEEMAVATWAAWATHHAGIRRWLAATW